MVELEQLEQTRVDFLALNLLPSLSFPSYTLLHVKICNINSSLDQLQSLVSFIPVKNQVRSYFLSK